MRSVNRGFGGRNLPGFYPDRPFSLMILPQVHLRNVLCSGNIVLYILSVAFHFGCFEVNTVESLLEAAAVRKGGYTMDLGVISPRITCKSP